MKRGMRAGLVAALSALLLGNIVGAAAPGPPAPGRPAPDLRLPTADGRTLSLGDLRGQVVLVDFWASWCAPCRQSFPALEGLFTDLRSRGFRVIAVNLDEKRPAAEAFLADRPHSFDVVFDPAGTSAKAFDVQGMPSSFLVGRDGKIRYLHMGFSDKVLDAYRREIEQLLSEPAGGEKQ